MGGDGALAETLGELMGDPFGHPAGVDEHQRRPMILDQFREAAIDLGPNLVRHHRFEGRTRHLDGQVAPALMAGVDDRNLRGGPAVRGGAGQEMGDGLNRILCCGEANPLEPVAAQRRQPLERERKMGAAFVRRDGMDFVDDDRAGARQHGAPGFRAEQDVERLRRRHKDMRRAPAHLVALGRRRVAGAHPGADFDVRKPALTQPLADARQRRLEIAVDVVRQRLERRDIDNLGRVGQAAIEALPHEVVDCGEKGRKRLARSGRGGDEGMAPGLDRGPRLGLGRGRRGEAVGEPSGDRRMKETERQGQGGRAPSTGEHQPVRGSARPGQVPILIVAARGLNPRRWPQDEG